MVIQGITWTQKEAFCLKTILKIQQHSINLCESTKEEIAGQYLQDGALFFLAVFFGN